MQDDGVIKSDSSGDGANIGEINDFDENSRKFNLSDYSSKLISAS